MNSGFRSEVVESKDITYFKSYHNPASDQAVIMKLTPEKAESMIATLSEYLRKVLTNDTR